MSTLKRFLKNTVIYGIAAVLPKAINVALVKLHTSNLSNEQFSNNTHFYVWIAYLNVLLAYGMETTFFRYFNKEKEKRKVVSTSFLSIFSTSIIALLALLLFKTEIANFIGFSKPIYFELLVWISILDALVVIPFAYLRVTNRPIRYTLIRILNITVFAFFNLLFLWYIPLALKKGYFLPEFVSSNFNFHFKEGYIFIANLIASVVTFFVLLPVIFKFKITFDKRIIKDMLGYSWPILIAGLAYITNENLDKLVIKDVMGDYEMGAYAAAYKIGVIMSLFIYAFKLGAEPFFFNYASKDNAKEAYAIIMKWFTIAGSLLMLFVMLYIDIIAPLLLGSSSFFELLHIVPIILVALLLFGIYNNLSIWYKLTDKTKYGMYFSVFGALITVAFLYLLVPKIGSIGAAWATLAAYGSMTVISYIFSRKHYLIPYNIKDIFFYLIFSVILFLIYDYYISDNLWIATAFFLFYLIVLFLKEKKELQKILKR
ncbi:oligosaccharide flippase family protein [Aureivirga marina]|uniref:oligosaccharide flippase family protein n=1 Tax=Aureivirga marina TaxID=1182451 RepID=UPI0018C94563|nr:polysaccharide biosynthesis C-terminal domain-containing protein [Aureivirga marina]